jgi:hypothetical protein
LVIHHPPISTARWHDIWPTLGELGLRNENIPVSFEVKTRGDLWEVLRDGKLVGGYVSHVGALDAARQAIQRIFCTGGAAALMVAS